MSLPPSALMGKEGAASPAALLSRSIPSPAEDGALGLGLAQLPGALGTATSCSGHVPPFSSPVLHILPPLQTESHLLSHSAATISHPLPQRSGESLAPTQLWGCHRDPGGVTRTLPHSASLKGRAEAAAPSQPWGGAGAQGSPRWVSPALGMLSPSLSPSQGCCSVLRSSWAHTSLSCWHHTHAQTPKNV